MQELKKSGENLGSWEKIINFAPVNLPQGRSVRVFFVPASTPVGCDGDKEDSSFFSNFKRIVTYGGPPGPPIITTTL